MIHPLQTDQSVRLKKGKDKALRNRHHWIFSGAIESMPKFKDGSILSVADYAGEHLGYAYFNTKSSIAGRMVSFGKADPFQTIEDNIKKAIQLRQFLFDEKETNGYRIINGEGDFLPGLTLDKYHQTYVMQLSTLGMEALRPFLLEILENNLKPPVLYEKSTGAGRKGEGLSEFVKIHSGKMADEVEIKENGLRFLVSIKEGQKTGFFLDHREMRQKVRTLAKDKKVLNCFSYTGGFSVYAAAGGASAVQSVDISEKAIEYARKNMALNGFSGKNHAFYTEDVFQFLRKLEGDFDFIILDPPAFAKHKKDQIQACRGYKDINRLAMQKLPPHSFLLTSSCSYYVDQTLFQQVVFQASIEACRKAKIIGRHLLGADHPINLSHPEGDYLKSLLLYIE